MKFQDLVLISELYEQPITVPGADPLKDIEQAGFEKIGSLVNHLVNPVQVAIDSYNLGTSIADAFGQYQADPTPGNALGFVALAGLGLITLKSGTGGEAGEIRALVNDIATQRDEIAKVASTIKLSETLNKLFTPARIEELAALKGMPKKELDDMLKATLPAAKIAAKEGKDAVKALPRDAKGRSISPEAPVTATPLKTAAQVADDNFTKSALATPAAKINWEMPPWNTMADGINTGLSKLPKPELRGTELGQYLKSRPEIDDIAKQNNITADQVRSYLDYAYPPTTVAPAATVTPATAATKLASKAPTSSTLRPTTPAQRAKNTELYKTVTKAKTPAPAAIEAGRMHPKDLEVLANKNPTTIGLAKNALRWVGSLTKDQYSKIDPETKTLIASFVLGLPSAAIGTGAGISAANSETGRQLKAFLSTPVGEMFKPSLQQQLKTLTGKRDKLAQSLGSAGWRPEQVKRLTASLDEQIKQMQELGIK